MLFISIYLLGGEGEGESKEVELLIEQSDLPTSNRFSYHYEVHFQQGVRFICALISSYINIHTILSLIIP